VMNASTNAAIGSSHIAVLLPAVATPLGANAPGPRAAVATASSDREPGIDPSMATADSSPSG